MKTLLVTFLIILFSSNFLAQEFGWADVIFLTGNAEEKYDDEIFTTTDLEGNIYITGKFLDEVVITSKHHVVETGESVKTSVAVTSNGGYDIFFAKFDADGVLEWATSFGGSGTDIGTAIACNSAGDVIITGQFEGTVDFGGKAITSSRKNNLFVSVFDNKGNIKWVQRAGGISVQPAVESGRGIAFDGSDNIYITGTFYGNDDKGDYTVPGTATFGDFQVPNVAQSTNSFVAKYTKDGQVLWVQTIAHYGLGGSNGICVDANGNSYITGVCSATFVVGAQVLNSNGIADIYVAKINADGTHGWFKQFGSGEKFNPVNAGSYTDPFEYGTGICSDAEGNLYVTGQFTDECQFGNFELDSDDGTIFLMKMNGAGDVIWATNTGGEYLNLAKAVTLDGNGFVYITGLNSKYGGIDVESDGYWKTINERGLGFVEKYNTKDGSLVWGAGAGSWGLSITSNTEHNIYLVGSFANQVKFDDETGLDIKEKIDSEYVDGGLFGNDKMITTYKAGTALYMVKILE